MSASAVSSRSEYRDPRFAELDALIAMERFYEPARRVFCVGHRGSCAPRGKQIQNRQRWRECRAEYLLETGRFDLWAQEIARTA